VPAQEALFSADQVTCAGRVVVDGRAMNKYEFAKPIAGRAWVETIFADADSAVPIRFETRGRSDADTGSTTVYRYDPAIRIDPPAVDLDERWSESLRRLSEEAEKGDPVCRSEFFAAVERGRMAAFEFEIKGRFESIPCCLTGIFVPPDAFQHRFTSYPRWHFREPAAAAGWAKNAVIMNLFPPPEYVGQIRCLGKVSVDDRDYDAYEYDFYRYSESARTLYSHRTMMVEEASGIPFRSISVSRRHVPQWVETRRYDPALTIPAPESKQRVLMKVGSPLLTLQAPPPQGTQSLPLMSGSAGAYWPPHGPNWPPFIFMPPAADWPPPP
jgi:hypothetical protein